MSGRGSSCGGRIVSTYARSGFFERIAKSEIGSGDQSALILQREKIAAKVAVKCGCGAGGLRYNEVGTGS